MNTIRSESDDKPIILIVDDVPNNIRILHETLKDSYTLMAVTSGEKALKLLKEDKIPDLILLDIMMPKMDGYEVCRKMKSNTQWADIPVIFISAKTDIQDIVKALEMGGVDYITKPFEPAEVEVRVKTHLTIREQEKRLEKQYVELQQLQVLRETLTNMIIHDLKSPLQAIMTFSEFLGIKAETLRKEEVKKYSGRIIVVCKTILDMIQSILDVTKMQEKSMQLDISEFEIREVMEEVQESLDSLLEIKGIILSTDISDDIVELQADREIIRRILINIIGNAIRFTPKNGNITLSILKESDGVRFMIADEGPGIPEADRERIFEKFSQVDGGQTGKKYSTGLGLTFCKMAVETHGGRIGVKKGNGGEGSIFWFILPDRN